jgi:hypothetical protein
MHIFIKDEGLQVHGSTLYVLLMRMGVAAGDDEGM